ncbi:MAG: alpha/beta hydrolase [Bacteroidales bacterium]
MINKKTTKGLLHNCIGAFNCIVAVILLFPSVGYCKDLNMDNSDYYDSEILVITNRVSKEDNQGLSFLCKVKPEASLTYLNVNVNVNENDNDNDNSLLDINQLDSNDFLLKISETDKNIVLFIHGDSKTFRHAIIRGLEIQNLYNVKVIVFSWPSKDPNINGFENLKLSIENVEKSLEHFNLLLNFVSKIKNQEDDLKNDKKMSLFLHSLGNYYLECMVRDDMQPDKKLLIFDNIIINSAAVKQKDHYLWMEQLKCQQNIYIISNKHDFNLKGARYFAGLGRQLGEIIDLPLAANATYINFSDAVGFTIPTYLSHTFFIGKMPQKYNSIFKFYNEMLNSRHIDVYDELNFRKRRDGKGYDILLN